MNQENSLRLSPSLRVGSQQRLVFLLIFKQGNDMNRCFTHIYALKARMSIIMEINP